MTNELEKQFFDTFGIEPQTGVGLIKFKEPHYPQITDTHYLKLICILHTTKLVKLCTTNVGDLKEEVLITLCCWVNHSNIKHQVRTLFEEG